MTPEVPSTPSFLETADGQRLAYHYLPGVSPTLVFLGGLASDMNGTKALHLEACCRSRGLACLRLDYQGHGASSGKFLQGGVASWSADAVRVIRHASQGPLLLAGSSLGAWIMLLIARSTDLPVTAMLGIAAAVDFTEDLIWAALSSAQQTQFVSSGVLARASRYADGPVQIGLELITQGRKHLLLREPIALHCPVRLIHGLADPDVPWRTSLRVMEMLESKDVRLDVIKHGDHRLSTAADLAHLSECLDELLLAGRGLNEAF